MILDNPPKERIYIYRFLCWIYTAKMLKIQDIFPRLEQNQSLVFAICFHILLGTSIARWGFQIFFIFTPIWRRFPIWLIFFQMGWNHQADWFPKYYKLHLGRPNGWKMSRTPTESAAKNFHHPTGTRSSMTFAEKRMDILQFPWDD